MVASKNPFDYFLKRDPDVLFPPNKLVLLSPPNNEVVFLASPPKRLDFLASPPKRLDFLASPPKILDLLSPPNNEVVLLPKSPTLLEEKANGFLLSEPNSPVFPLAFAENNPVFFTTGFSSDFFGS